MRITAKGQVTIPQRFRLKFGLVPHTDVKFEETDGGVTIRPALSKPRLLADRLRRARGVAVRGVRTDDIMRLTRGDD